MMFHRKRLCRILSDSGLAVNDGLAFHSAKDLLVMGRNKLIGEKRKLLKKKKFTVLGLERYVHDKP